MARPEIGKSSSLGALRDYLQDDCDMLQVWGGVTEDLDNYQVYISKNLEYYCIISSSGSNDVFTVLLMGDVSYIHEKNLMKIQEHNKKK